MLVPSALSSCLASSLWTESTLVLGFATGCLCTKRIEHYIIVLFLAREDQIIVVTVVVIIDCFKCCSAIPSSSIKVTAGLCQMCDLLTIPPTVFTEPLVNQLMAAASDTIHKAI